MRKIGMICIAFLQIGKKCIATIENTYAKCTKTRFCTQIINGISIKNFHLNLFVGKLNSMGFSYKIIMPFRSG